MAGRAKGVRRRSPRRPAWLRIVALVVVLLGLVARQRVVPAEPVVAAAASRVVSGHSPSVHGDALRVESAPRVAPAPRLARVRVRSVLSCEPRAPSNGRLIARVERAQRASVSTHFHAKRRIPRMNSEEPPRG